MSFAVENLGDNFNRLNFNTTTPWLKAGSHRRNLQIMPSDDEDEDEAVAYSSDSEEEEVVVAPIKNKAFHPYPQKKMPLPSDDKEEEEEDKNVLLPTRKKSMTSAKNNRSAQQQQQQQQGDGHTKQDDDDDKVIGQHFIRYPSFTNLDPTLLPPTSNNMHQYQYNLYQRQYAALGAATNRNKQQLQQQQQQQRMTPMSGMDLLIQREQEKAESKRQKPKMNPGKIKIQGGLLGKLPEAGSHNINFQQIQQQQQHQRQQHTTPSRYDYCTNNGGRSSLPLMTQQLPTFMTGRPNSAISQKQYYQKQRKPPIAANAYTTTM